MKKTIYILISLTLIIILTGCGKKTDNSKKQNKIIKQNTNITLKDQVINNLKFENFAITKDNSGVYIVFFTIANETDKDINVSSVNVKLYSEGAVVLTLKEDINKTLFSNESVDILENVDVSLKDIDKVEYILE